MSNTNDKTESVINEACNAYLIGDRSSPLHSSSSPSSSSSSSSSFVNGDLIDLCDQINEHDHPNDYSKHPVEAINSQLLADLNGKALQRQLQLQYQPPSPPLMLSASKDCYILYPTKVSFDNNVISGTTQQNQINHSNSNVLLGTAVSARSAEAIGRSSESSLIASASACVVPSSPPPTSSSANEQHQPQVIREFKRIGTYCTLRPEQRRKHLLKVLPTLRNSVLLQTLFGSNTTPKNFRKTHTDEQKQQQLIVGGNRDIDSLLIDLDDFIIDSNSTRMQLLSNHETPFEAATTLNSNSSSNGGRHANDMSTGHMKIVDPDKVEDCLLELDAYLEEIDREYVLACAAHGPNTNKATTVTAAVATTTKTATVTSQPLNNGTFVASSVSNSNNGSSKIVLRNHGIRPSTMDNSRTDCECSDRQRVDQDSIAVTNVSAVADSAAEGASNIRKQFKYNANVQMYDGRNVMTSTMASNETNGSRATDNQRKSNDIPNNQPLKRGHKLRNTVAGSGHNQNRAIASYDAPSQRGKHGKLTSLYFDFLSVSFSYVIALNTSKNWNRMRMNEKKRN